jgi:predicted hydrocarbon binding protein
MPTDPQTPIDLLVKAYQSLKPQQKAADDDDEEAPALLEAEFKEAQSRILRLVASKARPSGPDKALFLYAVEKSLTHLAGYASLNYNHVSTLVDLQASVANYDKSTSGKQADDIKPLTWLITSNPGEGKSHLVSCIAKAPDLKGKVSLVSYNMANMRTADDLIHALDEVRNVSVTGKLPMLFLDEVDHKEDNFGLLLPLLWDGEIQVGINRISIGRAVIVAAGSKPYVVNRRQAPPPTAKFRDFISRIKFDTAIPPLEPNGPGGIDQVCIAIAILRHTYKTENAPEEHKTKGHKTKEHKTKKHNKDDPTEKKKTELRSVPVRLLNFIYRTRFYYGVRSIRHLLDHLMNPKDKNKDIDDNGVLRIERLEKMLSTPELAAKSGLLTHIREEDRAEDKDAQLKGLVEDWAKSKEFSGDAPIWCKTFSELKRPAEWPEESAEFYNTQLLREQSGDIVHTFVGAGIPSVGVLYFFPERGEWKHGNDQLRHIFFNLRTIETIIRRFKKDQLYSLGYDMGKAFGQDFLERVEPLKSKKAESLKSKKADVRKELQNLIEEWCNFDISGGWGFWDSKDNEITVKNSFFVEMDKDDFKGTKVTDDDHAPHCVIMQGYIAGVLEVFSAKLGGVDNQFLVKETKCGIHDLVAQKKETECLFKWHRKEQPASPGKRHLRPAQRNRPPT